jgi:hypothetical protein
MNTEELSITQLVAAYNEIAARNGWKTVNKFKNRSEALRRVAKLQQMEENKMMCDTDNDTTPEVGSEAEVEIGTGTEAEAGSEADRLGKIAESAVRIAREARAEREARKAEREARKAEREAQREARKQSLMARMAAAFGGAETDHSARIAQLAEARSTSGGAGVSRRRTAPANRIPRGKYHNKKMFPLDDRNPFRKGSKSWAGFEVVIREPGITLGEYLRRGLRSNSIYFAIRQGWVKLED